MARRLMPCRTQRTHVPDMPCNHIHRGSPRFYSRRDLLRVGGLAAGLTFAGCLGGAAAPEAVALSDGLQCDVCGMIIEKHPGPNGQLFYQDESPRDHGNPARFDSLKHCFFPYRLEHEQRGWTETAAYVTDYSAVDYTLQSEGEATLISSHPEAAAFAPASKLTYVVGSDIQGAMGPDFIPFSNRADAESIAADYGGDLVAYTDIDEGLIGR